MDARVVLAERSLAVDGLLEEVATRQAIADPTARHGCRVYAYYDPNLWAQHSNLLRAEPENLHFQQWRTESPGPSASLSGTVTLSKSHSSYWTVQRRMQAMLAPPTRDSLAARLQPISKANLGTRPVPFPIPPFLPPFMLVRAWALKA